MPFPLAHPAAVLPLRRFCPRYLSFSALVVGSVAPDAAYFSGKYHLENLSHNLHGTLFFSLPASLFMLAIFYAFRGWAVGFLPRRYREIFLPLCRQPINSFFVIVVSILIGVGTHLLWDSFTHTHGWVVERLPALQTVVWRMGHIGLRVCHLLWYGCSLLGVACLCFAYQTWRQGIDPLLKPVSDTVKYRYALIVGLLVVPIEAFHHLVNTSIGLAAVGICTVALVLTVVVGIEKRLLPASSPQ